MLHKSPNHKKFVPNMSQLDVWYVDGFRKKLELDRTIYVYQHELAPSVMTTKCNEPENGGIIVKREAFVNYSTTLLLVLILLAGFSMYSMPGYMNNEGAKIWDIEYLTKREVLLFTVKITYSYNQEKRLKISVETSNPYSTHDRTIIVGPGTDTKAVDFELEPLPPQSTWYVTVTLYESDEKGEKMEALHIRNLDINLGEAKLRGELSTGLFPLLSVFSSAALIVAVPYLRRKQKKKKLEKRRKRRQ